MYAAKLSIHLRCPKHVRFNPETQGERAVKGGCIHCLNMCRVFDAVFKVEQAVRAAVSEGCAKPAPKVKPDAGETSE